MSIALITGANRGLGFATARALARTGSTVILTARDQARAEEAAATLREDGLDAHGLALDVTSPASITAAVALVGRPRLSMGTSWRMVPKAARAEPGAGVKYRGYRAGRSNGVVSWRHARGGTGRTGCARARVRASGIGGCRPSRPSG